MHTHAEHPGTILFRQCLYFALLITLSAFGQVTLILPEKTTPAEQTAAEELSFYLGKITGAPPEIHHEPRTAAGNSIHIGNTAYARSRSLRPDDFNDEEWLIRSYQDNLVITGGKTTGTLYAAYHYLEDVLGIHWFTPTVDYIPQNCRIILNGLNLRGQPDFFYRDIYWIPGPGRTPQQFAARNRLNTSVSRYGGRMIIGGPVHCHTMYRNVGKPDEIRALFKKHPEYFPLRNGKRIFDSTRAGTGAQSQFCLTHPGLRRLWIDKLRNHIRADREKCRARGIGMPLFYAVDQNDCYDGFCQCPACSAVVKKYGAVSALLLDFTNHVARELKDDAPESYFLMMALHITEQPPKVKMAVEPNVMIRLCDTTGNLLRPWTAECNSRHRRNLEGWASLGCRTAIWDYSITYGSFINQYYPLPSSRTYGPDMRFLKQLNGCGFFIEHEGPVFADLRDLKFWIECKLLENCSLDEQKLLRTFTDGFYGPRGGRKIREYISLLEQSADALPEARVSWFPKLAHYSHLTPETVRSSIAVFNQALRDSAGHPEYIERLEHARLSLDKYVLARYDTLRKILGSEVIPDFPVLLERYHKVATREFRRINLDRDDRVARMQKNSDKFIQSLKMRKNMPVPDFLKNHDRDKIFMFPAGMCNTFISYWKQIRDPDSSIGEAYRAFMKDITATPHQSYREHRYVYPFVCRVGMTMDGSVNTKIRTEGAKPQGYHWYKAAENIRFEKNSTIYPFSGISLAMDGVLVDNSQLGQKYDIWISMKITGGDFFKDGKPGRDNDFYIDQFAVVQKSENSTGTAQQK